MVARVGILAIQGDIEAHAASLARIGAEPVRLLHKEQLDGLSALVLPGGQINPDILRTIPEAVSFVKSFWTEGKAIGAIGQPGKGLGEFGEAHYMTMAPNGDIFVADTVRPGLQKFVRK